MRAILFTLTVSLVACISDDSSSTTYYVRGSVSKSGDGRSWSKAFKTIQEGVNEARDGDMVMVAEGTYFENIQLKGKSIMLRSRSPGNPTIVKTTIIDGSRAGSVVSYSGTESGVLSGFTIQNGAAVFGGGIYGGDLSGGAATACSARIENNIIQDNSVKERGGGVFHCKGLIVGNLIRGNHARHGAGLAYCRTATIRHNTITENVAEAVGPGGELEGSGGGLHLCHGLIESNVIRENRAHFDGGGLVVCDGTIQNNVIVGNTAGDAGGGIYYCDGTIQNNTITGNSASTEGGGLATCPGIIRNVVIWGNTATDDSQLSRSSVPTYSCIQDWTGGGEGNTDRDPRFVDRDGPDNDLGTYEDNDYRLSAGSSCIDAGDNAGLNPPGFDLDGNLRIAFGEHSVTVDMGAYEYNSGAIEIQEILRLGASAVRLTWRSQPNDTYTIWSCADLLTGTWIEEGTVPSHGAETPWTDTAASGHMKLYRIEMK